MTPDDILAKVLEARAICEKATPGRGSYGPLDAVARTFYKDERGYMRTNDATFIQCARTGWPEALDLIEDLVAAIEIQGRSSQETETRRAELDAVIANARKLLGDLPDLPPAPPPGKMRVTASVPVSYDVSPGQIAAYLRAKEWARGRTIDPLVQCFRAPPDHATLQRPVYIIPQEYADWAERTHEILKTAAAVENRSTGEVLRDIAAMEEA